jgi:uncharacterized protein YggL (DUF469 family)
MGACPRFGFAVQMEPAPGVTAAHLSASFLQLLAARGLEDVGAAEPPELEFLVASEAGQATDDDREAILAWLGARGEVGDYGVGPLVDLDRAAA